MFLRVGCDLAFTLPAPTAVVLMLHLHPSVAARARGTERLQVLPAVPAPESLDVSGNRFTRVFVPAGPVAFRHDAVVADDGRPDPHDWAAYQHPVQDLPPDALLFLLA